MDTNNKPRAFISFDYDHDEWLKHLFVWQIKNSQTPFYFEDWSAKEPRPQKTWKDHCKEKMNKCDVVLVLCWEFTYNCSGVKAEIEIAHELDLPVIWIRTYNWQKFTRPNWLDDKCLRNRDDIKNIYLKILREKNESRIGYPF